MKNLYKKQIRVLKELVSEIYYPMPDGGCFNSKENELRSQIASLDTQIAEEEKKAPKGITEEQIIEGLDNPYPESVFIPIPDDKIDAIIKLLKDNGYSPDCLFGNCGRYVWDNCVKKLSELLALQEVEETTELENKLIDFANWYLRLIKVTTDKDERHDIENREIVWSFLRGDDYKLWWNKFEGEDEESYPAEFLKWCIRHISIDSREETYEYCWGCDEMTFYSTDELFQYFKANVQRK